MIKVWHFIPFSITKNLGQEYNAYMEMIPDTDSACFTDGDVLHLVPDFGTIIHRYANEHPDAVLTCYTNRIHNLAKGQQSECNSIDVKTCIEYANGIKHGKSATKLNGPISGFLLVVPKKIWKDHKFTEENIYRPGEPNLLGVDNIFTNSVRMAGIQILRMDSLIVFHSYRLLSNGLDKSHLL